MRTNKYEIRAQLNGMFLDGADTREEAMETLRAYEADDRENGCWSPKAYELVTLQRQEGEWIEVDTRIYEGVLDTEYMPPRHVYIISHANTGEEIEVVRGSRDEAEWAVNRLEKRDLRNDEYTLNAYIITEVDEASWIRASLARKEAKI